MSPFKPVRGGHARKQVLPDISLLAAPALKASSVTSPHAVLSEGTAASSKRCSDLQVSVPPRASFSSFWSSQFSPLPATITCPTAEPGVDISGLLLTDPSTDPHAESSGEEYRLDEGSEIVTSTSSISGSWQAYTLSVASAPLSSSFSPSSYSPSSLLSPVSATESASPPLSPSRRTTSLPATDPFGVETACGDSTDPSFAAVKIRWASERDRAERLELEVSALKAEMAASREEMRMEREEYEAAIDALKASLARLMREHSEEIQQLRALLEEASGAKASLANEASSVEGDRPDFEQGGADTADEGRDVAGWHGDEADVGGCEGYAGEKDLHMDEERMEGGRVVDREKDNGWTGADAGTYKDKEWTEGQGNVEWLQQKLQESQARVAELEREVMVLGERLLDARKRVTAGMVQMEMMSLCSGMERVQAVPRFDAHAVEAPECDDDCDDDSSCDGGAADVLCVEEVVSATCAAATAPSEACCSLDLAIGQVDKEEDKGCKDDDHGDGISADASVSLAADAHGSSASLGSCDSPEEGVDNGRDEQPVCEEAASAHTDRKVRFRECVEVFGSEVESLDCTERMLLSDEKGCDWQEMARARDRQKEWWPTGQSVREQRKLTCSDHNNAWQDSQTHGYEWETIYGAEEMLGEQRNSQQWKGREMLLQQMEAQVQCVEERLGDYCSDIAGQMKVDMQALAQQLLNGMVSWQGWKEKRKPKKSLAADPAESQGKPPCATVSGADSAAAAVGSCDESCTGSGFVPQPLDVVAACVSEVMFEDFECDRFQRAAYCEFTSDSERCARNYDKFLVQRWRRGPMNPLREPNFVSFCERKAERVADVLVGAMLAVSPLAGKHDAGLSRSDSAGSNSTSNSGSSSNDSCSMEDSSDRDSPLSGTTWATDTMGSDDASHVANRCDSGNNDGGGGVDAIVCGSGISSEKFLALARAVWALHALAWAFLEPARIYRVQPFSPFSSSFMRAVNREWVVHGALHKQHMAAFAILPAFVIGSTVLCGKVIVTVQEKHQCVE
ncbi:unnamed protein product [Closterium sp. NIES-54]